MEARRPFVIAGDSDTARFRKLPEDQREAVGEFPIDLTI
jgi:hypothetical protein